MMHSQTTASFLRDHESERGRMWKRPSPAEVISVTVVCLCRGSIVVMRQEQWDQGGRKGLRRGLSGRKRGRQDGRGGEVIPRSQSLMPDITAMNGRGEKERCTIQYVPLISGWAVAPTPCKPPVIPTTIYSLPSFTHHAMVLLKPHVDASQYFKTPHYWERDPPSSEFTCVR